MSESVEVGAGLAWRLLATLEGGSLLLATSALLAYTARVRVAKKRSLRNVQRVLITNISNPLGRALKSKLETCRCIVSTATSDAASGAGSEIDALVIVGAEPQDESLNHIAELVSEDVYNNLRFLDSLAPRLRSGGCIVWVCVGATHGAYRDAIAAFDSVLRASLQHAANISRCEAIWIGRSDTAERAAERTVAELTPNNEQHPNEFSLRNAAHKVSEYLGRWLKIIT